MVFFRRVLKDEDIVDIINLSYERAKTCLFRFLAKGTIRSGHGYQVYHLFRTKTNGLLLLLLLLLRPRSRCLLQSINSFRQQQKKNVAKACSEAAGLGGKG